MTEQVRVTVSGLTGSGKTAIYMEIVTALQAIGVPVSHADPKEFQRLLNSGEGDSHDGIELYKPTVIMEEHNVSRAIPKNQGPDAIVLAYGLLWHMTIDNRDANLKLASDARKALSAAMSRDDQTNGIILARVTLRTKEPSRG